MLVGPVFSREMMTAPRRPRLYVLRAVYAAALVIVICTAWLAFAGTQVVRNVGDLARFGGLVFQILAPLQWAIAVFFSALAAASAVAQEKDRRTFELLLLTRLSNGELVLGRLLASLLHLLMLIVVAVPLLVLLMWFGGVALDQVLRVAAVTAASALVAGSLGSTIALRREKTFQALALTALVLFLWLACWEVLPIVGGHRLWAGVSLDRWAVIASPWRAVLEAAQPRIVAAHAGPLAADAVLGFLAFAALGTALVNGLAIGRVRAWNPHRELRASTEDEPPPASAPAAAAVTRRTPLPRAGHRPVWDNPILWREVRTAAYGRRMLLIRLVYLLLFCGAAAALYQVAQQPAGLSRTSAALPLAPLLVLSLILVNAQAVTAITSERDARALDLLLVTDLTPKEFIFGKLAGIFYNTKEMVLLPLLLAAGLWWIDALSLENLIYLAGSLLVLFAFAAMLGVHTGLAYGNSRAAIATSLGTMFFLFLGIALCLRLMVAFSGSFQVQLQPFLAFMLGGGIGLYVALGVRNPSTAIGAASMLCPFATFYAITSYLLGYTLAVFLVTSLTYGFATAAMLVPAIFEFDVATGRTTLTED